jgi:hypothetical protein
MVGLDAARDGREVRVGVVARDLCGVGIDREDLVAALLEPVVNGVAAVSLGMPGDTCHCDASARKEVLGGRLDTGHIDLLRQPI